MGMDEAVNIRAGQRDNDRLVWMKLMKIRNRTRAAPGVQRNHDVSGFACIFYCHAYAMAKPAQNVRPAHRGRAIASA
jgi:hypothetical protein